MNYIVNFPVVYRRNRCGIKAIAIRLFISDMTWSERESMIITLAKSQKYVTGLAYLSGLAKA